MCSRCTLSSTLSFTYIKSPCASTTCLCLLKFLSSPSEVTRQSLYSTAMINSMCHSSRTQEEQVPFFSKCFKILLPSKACSFRASSVQLPDQQLTSSQPLVDSFVHVHSLILSSARQQVHSTCQLVYS